MGSISSILSLAAIPVDARRDFTVLHRKRIHAPLDMAACNRDDNPPWEGSRSGVGPDAANRPRPNTPSLVTWKELPRS